MNSKPITYPMVQWFATRLSRIPVILDDGDGEINCRVIGEEISNSWGFKGMQKVCEYCRDNIGRELSSAIETAWDGIDSWQR